MKIGMFKDLSGDYDYMRCGWKIHLAVAPASHEYVYEWLLRNSPYGCKYGMNSGQDGKDFTIYVGGWNDTVAFSKVISRNLEPFLLPIQGDALKDDLKLSDKIGARFDVSTSDKEFHQYGSRGLPYLKYDQQSLLYDRSKVHPIDVFLKRSFFTLSSQYGDYFTGSNPEDVKILVGISDKNKANVSPQSSKNAELLKELVTPAPPSSQPSNAELLEKLGISAQQTVNKGKVIFELPSDFKRFGCGWKVYFGAKPESIKVVEKWLVDNYTGQFKYNPAESEKAFAVYVGSWNSVLEFIRKLGNFKVFLLPVRNTSVARDAGLDVLPLTYELSAVFEFTTVLPSVFISKNLLGLPVLVEDGENKVENVRVRNSFNFLYKTYRDYFASGDIENIKVIFGISEQIKQGQYGPPGPKDYRPKGGWKIHLAVAGPNLKRVYEWLLNNSPYGWKFGSGGEVGKDFTIYLTSWKNIVSFADTLKRALWDYLHPVSGQALVNDLKVNDRVAARCECFYPIFNNYGTNGLQYLKEDWKNRYLARINKQEFDEKAALRRAFAKLSEIQGDDFDGGDPEGLKKLIGI